jgi:hypothetical protein
MSRETVVRPPQLLGARLGVTPEWLVMGQQSQAGEHADKRLIKHSPRPDRQLARGSSQVGAVQASRYSTVS